MAASECPLQGSEESPTPSNLLRHQCYLCSRTYERQDHLSRHLKSHENERSHRCPECRKGFNRADLLNRHRSAHVKNAGETFRRRTGRACAACIRAKTKCDEERPCKRCRTREVPCQESEKDRRHSMTASQGPLPPLGTRSDAGDSQGLSQTDDEPKALDIDADLMPSTEESQQSSIRGSMQQQSAIPETGHLKDASLLLGLSSTNANDSGLIEPHHEPRLHNLEPYLESHSQPPPQPYLEARPRPQPYMQPHMQPHIQPHPPSHASYNSMPNDFRTNNFALDNVGVDFFEQIMMPEAGVGLQHNMAMPIGMSTFTQDLSFDLCDFDFGFLASGLTRPSTAQGPPAAIIGTTPEGETPTDAQLRSEAFKRSPWSWDQWIPERNSHTFSGQDEINTQQDRVHATDQLTSLGSMRLVHIGIDQAARDRMIRTVTKIGHERLAMPSFPPLELLEDLVDIFLLQDSNAIDSYLHAATFDCNGARTELLLAMVAAGARYIALPPVWKMGLVIQEVVRLAIGEVYEQDNSSTRELQVLQVALLWLDIGVFSGFRRKTEIALSFLQPTVTMLSWSNAFRRFRYRERRPAIGDTDDQLESKWKAWAEQEGFKRLVIHTFLHDSQVAIVNLKNPLLSAAQLQLPLPACRELWLAPNAQAWRNWYFKSNVPLTTELPSMVEFFGHTKMLEQFNDTVDKDLCLLTACHGLGHEVWTFRQHARLLSNWQNHGRRDRWLSHVTQQRDLYDDMCTFMAYCEVQTNASPEIMLTVELLMMSLHVDLEDVQTFSGKAGEDEARKVFKRIIVWVESAESRTAVRHAGQVLRVARTFPKTKLRDFYAVALYHAALTLWVYGMVTSNAARKSSTQTPLLGTPRTPHNSHTTVPVSLHYAILDASDDKVAKAFTLLGQGVPGLQNFQSVFVPLSDSKGVMVTAEAVLKGNFPQSRNGLPPLVENLANLISELGKLSGKD